MGNVGALHLVKLCLRELNAKSFSGGEWICTGATESLRSYVGELQQGGEFEHDLCRIDSQKAGKGCAADLFIRLRLDESDAGRGEFGVSSRFLHSGP